MPKDIMYIVGEEDQSYAAEHISASSRQEAVEFYIENNALEDFEGYRFWVAPESQFQVFQLDLPPSSYTLKKVER